MLIMIPEVNEPDSYPIHARFLVETRSGGKGLCLVKGDSYSVTTKRNTVREANVPVPFTFIDLEADARVGWWMVYRSIENEEIWPQLSNGKRHAIEHQSHSDVSGMSAVTRL
jgi:hypothetical protein